MKEPVYNEKVGVMIKNPTADMVQKQISDILIDCGFQIHSIGYMYLKEAVIAVLCEEERLLGVTKKLYPYVAERYITSAEAVERGIRRSINEVCKKDSPHRFRHSIPEGKIHFTNKEFIALVVNEVKNSASFGI